MTAFILRARRAALACIACAVLASGCGSAPPVAPTFRPVPVAGDWLGAVENDIVAASGQTDKLATLDAVSSFSLQRR
jgi:hypothetical protein